MTLNYVQDASNPAGIPKDPKCIVTAGYIGGDTPHVWTQADWQQWGNRYRVPIWVRSNPQDVDATADANACVATLQAIGAPAPYLVLPYGSTGNIFTEPVEDGYWVAFPGNPVLYPHAGVVASQYVLGAAGGAYDLSVIDESVPTWDTATGLGPTAVMCDLETAGYVQAPGYVTTFAQILHAVPGPNPVYTGYLVTTDDNSAFIGKPVSSSDLGKTWQ